LTHTYPRALTRFILMAVLAVVAAGLAAAPARASQVENPNPPAKSEPGQPAQAGPAKTEEAEEENAYRHTSLVTAISDKVFRDHAQTTPADVRERHIETTARTFEWINTLIILLAIVLPIARILPKILRKRDQTLKHNLEVARTTTTEANARLAAVEAQITRLDEEIAKIRAHVEEEAGKDEARIKASIEEEGKKIVGSAEQEIAAAAAHAQRELKAFAADLAIEQAAKQLILTPETDRVLIQEFVASAAGDGQASLGNKGGHS